MDNKSTLLKCKKSKLVLDENNNFILKRNIMCGDDKSVPQSSYFMLCMIQSHFPMRQGSMEQNINRIRGAHAKAITIQLALLSKTRSTKKDWTKQKPGQYLKSFYIRSNGGYSVLNRRNSCLKEVKCNYIENNSTRLDQIEQKFSDKLARNPK